MVDDDDFNFFLKFCTSVLFNLPDVKDRTLGAQWLQRLRELHGDDPEDTLCIEYLKLLLFAMQKEKLGGIFQNPPPDGPLQTFSGTCMATDMVDLAKPSKIQMPTPPSIHMSFSGDLCEFVAVQEIPNFGLHGYYAISTDPLPTWIQPRVGILKAGKQKSANNFQQRGLKPFPVKPKPETEYKKPPLPEDIAKCMMRSKDSIVEKIAQQRMQQFDMNPNDTKTKHTLGHKKEIPNTETRPCWGRNRYIESLLDQSPHVAADLDVPQIDAFLHAFKDRKMKVADSKNKDPCSVSPQRKRVEMMMDLPCTLIPDQEKDMKCRNFEEKVCYRFDYPIGADTMVDTDILETSSADLDWWDKRDNEQIAYSHDYSRMGTSHPHDMTSGTHPPTPEFKKANESEMNKCKHRIRSGARTVKPKEKNELHFRDISKIEASSSDKSKRPSKSLKKESLNESWKPLAHSSFLN